VGVSAEVHDSIGIIERLRTNLAATGAIFLIATGILVLMYFLSGRIPIIWQGPINTVCFLAAAVSGILILYSICYAGLVWIFMWRRIHRLAGDEETTLREFVAQNAMTVSFLPGTAGPGSLIQAGIIGIEANIGELAREKGAFWYTIKPWIFRYLKKHKNLIGL
jgi:hypothetical protein